MLSPRPHPCPSLSSLRLPHPHSSPSLPGPPACSWTAVLWLVGGTGREGEELISRASGAGHDSWTPLKYPHRPLSEKLCYRMYLVPVWLPVDCTIISVSEGFLNAIIVCVGGGFLWIVPLSMHRFVWGQFPMQCTVVNNGDLYVCEGGVYDMYHY